MESAGESGAGKDWRTDCGSSSNGNAGEQRWKEKELFAEAQQEERKSEEVMDKMENDLKREAMIRDILEEFLA